METYIPTKFYVDMWLLFKLWVWNLKERRILPILPIIAQYIYDEEDLGHPYIFFSHTSGFCFHLAFSHFAFPMHMFVSSAPHPSDYVHTLSAYSSLPAVFLPTLSLWISLSAWRVSCDTSHLLRTFCFF